MQQQPSEAFINLRWFDTSKLNVILTKPNGNILYLSTGDKIAFNYYEQQVNATIESITFYGEEAQPTGFILTFSEETNKDIKDYLTRFYGKMPIQTINSINIIGNKIKETKVGGSRGGSNLTIHRKTYKKHKTLRKKHKQLKIHTKKHNKK